MNRISDISSREDFIVEMQRETLRDKRWQRRRSKIFAATLVLMLGMQMNVPSLLLA